MRFKIVDYIIMYQYKDIRSAYFLDKSSILTY